jgi:predicted RNase H-like nuclease
MTIILALDAAWTATEPTGVALVASYEAGWRCVAVAPSYDSFLGLADGVPVLWAEGPFPGCVPNIPKLLEAAQFLAKSPVDLVTIDMPIGTFPITARREADNAISRQFGGRGCSTHTPSATRPGSLGATLSAAFHRADFPIATVNTEASLTHHLLEVYPHPALLALLGRPYRVPYKAGNTRRYWPGLTLEERIGALLSEYSAIHAALVNVFGPMGVSLPLAVNVLTLSTLKRFEDALDALVCAWVGVLYMQGKAIPFGDDTAAIWCPSDA